MKKLPPLKTIGQVRQPASTTPATKPLPAVNQPSRFVDGLVEYAAELEAEKQAKATPIQEEEVDGRILVELENLPRVPLRRPALPKRGRG